MFCLWVIEYEECKGIWSSKRQYCHLFHYGFSIYHYGRQLEDIPLPHCSHSMDTLVELHSNVRVLNLWTPKIFAVITLIWASFWENRSSGFPTRSHINRLCSHRKRLEAWNLGFRKKRDCTIRVAKTKALISFAVTAKLICVFVFA